MRRSFSFSLLAAALALAALSPATAGLVPLQPAATAAPLSANLQAQLATALPTDQLVVFVHGTDLAAAVDARDAAGLDGLGEWSAIDVAVAAGTPAQIASLRTRPGIEYLEGNDVTVPLLDTAKEATRASEAEPAQWPITTTVPNTSKQCSKPSGAKKGCHPTTSTRLVGPFDGSGRSIAVIDSGVDGTHPMFRLPDGSSKVVRNLKLVCMNNTPAYFPDLAGQGQFPPDNCPADPALQDQLWADLTAVNDTDTLSLGGHGTHVASIAAGVATPYGDRVLSGTAPGAKVVSLSVGGSLGVYGSNTALDWVSRHHAAPCGTPVDADTCPPITVVNLSIGTWGNQEFDPSAAATKFQRVLVDAGVVVVWANGNGDPTTADGGNGSDNRSNPPAQDPTPGIIGVANYDDGNTGTRDGALHSSSSRGEKGRIGTYPDVSAPGTNITAACRPYLTICQLGGNVETDFNFGTITGTSMAAPHVAGVVAVLQQAIESTGVAASPAAIEDILEDTAHEFGAAESYEADVVAGEAQARNADDATSFDKGHGLIDVVNALNRIFSLAATSPAPKCAAGTTGFEDAANDTVTALVPTNAATYDGNVDLIGFDVAGGAGALGFRFEVADLTAADVYGMSLAADFDAGGAAHSLLATRTPGATSMSVTFDGAAADAVWDVDADTVTVAVPWPTGPVSVAGVRLESRQDTGALLAPLSDTATAPCTLSTTVA